MCTVSPDRLDRASTDGSSGEPLSFMLDRNRSPIEYAFIHDAWSRAGFTAHDWRCVFRGFDLADRDNIHMESEPALRELRFSIFHLDDATMASYLSAIRERKICFIHGYPSAMTIFAQYLVRTGAAPLSQIRGVFPISEKLFPHQRDLLAQVFDRATIVPFYGLSEKVAFAVERAGEADTYEFNPIYGYTELVDDEGRPIVTPGQAGRGVDRADVQGHAAYPLRYAGYGATCRIAERAQWISARPESSGAAAQQRIYSQPIRVAYSLQRSLRAD
jgi:phenylacetate-CoA ligase